MSYFDHLDTPPEASKSAAKAAASAPRFPCQSCAGTGKYRGVRTRQTESKCFACNGVGSFATSHGDRMKARAKAAESRKSKLEQAQAATNEQHPGLVDFLRANTWSEFLRDMLDRYNTKGGFSDPMVDAIRRTQAKCEARQAERNAQRASEQAARTTALDLNPIHAMFDKAKDSGLKKPVYRAEGMVLSLAPSGGANAGAIYIKTKGGEYLGKVVGQQFMATREVTDEHKQLLAVIAANPSKAAHDYGKRTGECCCCGRELTDPASIAAGIGPICADKWGF